MRVGKNDMDFDIVEEYRHCFLYRGSTRMRISVLMETNITKRDILTEL